MLSGSNINQKPPCRMVLLPLDNSGQTVILTKNQLEQQ